MKSHHLADGTFKNNYIDSIDKPFSELLKWQWNRVSPEPLAFPLAENDPVFLKNNRIEPTLTWIGHSTLLLQFDGFNILTDPHMTQRASPVSFAGPKRFMKPGISIEELPHIDLIVISHNHYDHLDRLTLEKIYQKQEDQPPKIFVPLRQKKWFEGLDITNVVEMDWWEEQEFEVWKIHAVPVQHWSGRSLWDRNRYSGQDGFWNIRNSGFSLLETRVTQRISSISAKSSMVSISLRSQLELTNPDGS